MKKLILAGLLAFSCLFASAQSDLQGKWFVGGQLGYQSLKNAEIAVLDREFDEVKNFSIMPTVGTFISPSVALGLSVGYENSKGTIIAADDTKVDTKLNAFVIAPFARKYWNITSGLYFFGEAALPVAFGSSKVGDIDESKISSTNIGLTLAPGFEYFINDWISVDTKLTVFSAAYSSVKPKGGDSESDFSIGANTNANKFGDLTIGVKFLF